MKKNLRDITIKNFAIELIGREPYQSFLNVFNRFYIFSNIPCYVLKIARSNIIRCKRKSKFSTGEEISRKFFFPLNFEVSKNVILVFTYKFDFKEFKLELRTGRNFLYMLKEPRILDFFGPSNFLITSILKISGFGKLTGLDGQVEIGSGFNRIYFFLFKIYPHYIKKEIVALEGVKFISYTIIYPLFTALLSSISGFYILLNDVQNKKGFKFSQICNLKGYKLVKFRIFFMSSKCSLYLTIINFSILSTFKISFKTSKSPLNFESLGKIEDSLILSLTDTSWGLGGYCYLIGSFSDGKIIIWNEILVPLVQFINCSFVIINLRNEKKPFDFFIVLKKNLNITKEFGRKKNLKLLPQTILCNITISKFKIKKNLNKEWFLLKILNLTHLYNFKGNLLYYSKTFSVHITFFLKFNRCTLFLIQNFKNKVPIQSKFLNLRRSIVDKNTMGRLQYRKEKNISCKLLFNLSIMGNKRKFTRKEILSDQFLIRLNFKYFFYKKCPTCSRNWKIKIKKSKESTCPFYHGIEKPKIDQKWFKKTRITEKFTPNFHRKETFSTYKPIFKSFLKKNLHKNDFFQKERMWVKILEKSLI